MYFSSSWFWGIGRYLFNGINVDIFHFMYITTCVLITLCKLINRVKGKVVLAVNVEVIKNREGLDQMVGPGISKIAR